MATAALVHSVCGLYRLRAAPGAELAHPGFPAEVASSLLAGGGATGPVRIGRVDVLLHRPAALAIAADRLAAAERDLELRLHTEVIAADVAATGVRLDLVCRGRRAAIEADVLVDASGDGVAAALAGAACEMEAPDRLQRPAYVFALGGVEPGAADGERRLRIAHRIAAAARAGELGRAALGTSLRAIGAPGEVFVTIDLAGPPGAAYDPTDPACLTALELHGRDLADRVTAFLRSEADGFRHAFVAALPARAGVRESRRVVGEVRLEAADLERSRRFPDAIALATWPIEMRETAIGPKLRFPATDDPCEIPLRALRARGRPRLLIAGRCLSASHEAQASIRVIGTCLATGEAAGLAAAALADGAHREAASAGVTSGVTDAEVALAVALAERVRELRERHMVARAPAAVERSA